MLFQSIFRHFITIVFLVIDCREAVINFLGHPHPHVSCKIKGQHALHVEVGCKAYSILDFLKNNGVMTTLSNY